MIVGKNRDNEYNGKRKDGDTIMSLETSKKILKVSGFLAIILSVLIYIAAGNVRRAYKEN